MSQHKQKKFSPNWERKKVEVSYCIVTCIWLSLCSFPRRLPACEGANSDLVYRNHMSRKQGLKDAALRTRFDEFPMIWAWVYSFLLWNRHPVAHAPGRDERQRGSLKLQCGLCFHTSWIAFPISEQEVLVSDPNCWQETTRWRLPLSLTIIYNVWTWSYLKNTYYFHVFQNKYYKSETCS